ncbi:alkaline phosphatase family protein [Streptomyces sp. NPDC048636]|uniref:alkaline phosphatase family protein n=1 Tax=Streptomyces sp. NPDC048636 TaxID=3155762 RepID=UPI003435A15F
MILKTRDRIALATAVVAATVLPLSGAVHATAAGGTSADTAAYQGLPHGSKKTKTLVIGVDGATYDVLAKTPMPRLKALMAQGMTATSNLYADPFAPTLSAPGWASVATGVWPDKHEVTSNFFWDTNFEEYPDYATRLETADPAISTLTVGTWEPITDEIFGEKTDRRIEGEDDTDTTRTAADYLAHGDPDSTFVHLNDVDEAGHSSGTASRDYTDALTTTDQRIGQLLDAVAARPGRALEDWLIVVTADHGHTADGGHGDDSPAERKTFVIAKGAGMRPGSQRNDIKLTDIAPTVLAHEGVATDPAWGLDGAAIPTVAPDDFDTVRGALRTRADETEPGADVKGWTTTPPRGWTIDNSRMPAGGVTEWRGWSFATDEFWTNTDLGQGREANVRARDVFAVADSDEWDDKPHDDGRFDSTLVSPAYPLRGSGAVTVSYANHYQIDGPQTGDVYAVWDGGEPVRVRSYRSDTNAVEHLRLTPPPGARSLQLRFRYTGDNSAFWTVDRVAVRQPAPAQPSSH